MSEIELRKLTEDDATEKYVSWLNDPEVNQYLESRFMTHTIESTREFIRGLSANDYMFGIFLRGKHIGNIKLHVNPQHKYGDIGFLIGDKGKWGKGYATQAIRLIVEFAFKELNLNKVWAGVYANNFGSIRALSKAGFTQEATLQRQYLCEGKYINGVIMGIWRE